MLRITEQPVLNYIVTNQMVVFSYFKKKYLLNSRYFYIYTADFSEFLTRKNYKVNK